MAEYWRKMDKNPELLSLTGHTELQCSFLKSCKLKICKIMWVVIVHSFKCQVLVFLEKLGKVLPCDLKIKFISTIIQGVILSQELRPMVRGAAKHPSSASQK